MKRAVTNSFKSCPKDETDLKTKNMKSLYTLIALVLTTSLFAGQNGVDPTKKSLEKWERTLSVQTTAPEIQTQQDVVYVSFEIGMDGSTEKVEVESSLNEDLDQKAIEVVKGMPKEHLYENGFIEGTRFIIPVKFSIQ